MTLLSVSVPPLAPLWNPFRTAGALLTCLAAGLLLALGPHSALARATILNASPTVHPGDVIYVQGDSFGTGPKAQYSYNGSTWTLLPLLSFGTYAGASSVTAQIPTSAVPTGLLQVRVTPDNGASWSAAVVINQPHAMSYDTPEIASGSAFRIYGRNLLYPGLTPTVRLVDETTHASQSAGVNLTGSTAYVLDVTAPLSIVQGHVYDVYVSSGFTGTGAETKADETLNGRNYGTGATDVWNLGLPWGADFPVMTQSNVYNAVTQYGADPTGGVDSHVAIQNAINDASNAGGGVVYLPAGTYILVYDPTKFGLMLKSNVVLAGAGNGQTTIEYGFGPAPQVGYQGFGVMFGDGYNPVSKCGIADVTIQNMDTSGQWLENLLVDSNGGISSEVFLQRVHLRSTYGNQTLAQNMERFAIENSDFSVLGDPVDNTVLLGGNLTNYVCRSNTYEWSGGQATSVSAVTNGVIENNTYTRDCSANYPHPINTRAFDNSYLTNVAILNNTFAVKNGPPLNQNDGDTCTVEDVNPVDTARGSVTAATSTTVSDSTQTFPQSFIGGSVMIVRGAGTGQWRNITGVSQDGHTLTLNAPWKVTPLAGSHYATFGWSAANMTIAANVMSGERGGVFFYFCPIHDVLIDGNQISPGGILLQPYQRNPIAGDGTSPQFHPQINVQITNNTASDTATDPKAQEPSAIGAIPIEDGDNGSNNNFGVLVLGVEVRGNMVTGNSPNFNVNYDPTYQPLANEGYCAWEFGYDYHALDDGTPAILDMIFQNDTANNIDNATYTNTDPNINFGVAGPLTQGAYSLASGTYQTVIFNPVSNNVKSLLFDNILPYEYFQGNGYASVNTTKGNLWTDKDVGNVGLAGSTTTLGSAGPNSNVFTVSGGGGDIWGSSDGFNFCYQTLTGNGTITARVTNIGNTNSGGYSKAGVMIRASLSATSVYADTILEWNGQSGGDYRTTDGAAAVANGGVTAPAPYWVRIKRSGSTFTSWLAPDNSGVPGTWVPSGGAVTITMPSAVYAGLVVSSAGGGALNTSTFDHVTVTTP